MKFELSDISKYRTQLMGCATIMILLCHANGYGVVLPSFLRNLLVYGNLGVDIFLFLSGFGCFYSLGKANNIMTFYKRRMLRILLPYITISVFFLIIDEILQNDFCLEQWLLELSTISFWVQHKGTWFVALIIPIYLISPFVYKLFQFTSRKLIVCMLLITSIMVLTSHDVYPSEDSQYELIDNLQWAFGRSISFIIGMYFAFLAMKEMSINIFLVISVNIVIFVVLRFAAPIWFRNWCYVIPIIVSLCYLFSITKKCVWLSNACCWMGVISFESYLTNVGYNHRMQDILGNTRNMDVFNGHYLDYCLILIMGLLTAYLVNRLIRKINNLITLQ